MMYTTALILFVLVAIVSDTVDAFPDGAGACNLGKASPGDPHTSAGRNPQTGPLATAGFIVKIGDIVLDTATSITVKPDEDIRVVVTSPEGNVTFRGAMVIVSKAGLDTADTFSLTAADATKLKISPLCASVAANGVTHINNDDKTSVEATMRFDENIQDLSLDVNIVVINQPISLGGSFYYYSQYKINVEGPTSAPTMAPTGRSGLFARFFAFLRKLFFGN